MLAGVGIAAGTVMALVLLTAFSGWRYGFTPLPEPDAGVNASALARPVSQTVPSDDYTRWLVSGDFALWNSVVPAPGAGYLLPLGPWAEYGTNALPRPRALWQELAAAPEAVAALVAVRAGRVPPTWGAPRSATQFARALRMAAYLPLWDAALHEEAGQGVAALDDLLLAWELGADHWVFPYADSTALCALGPPPELVFQAWARIALTTSAMSVAESARVLGRMDEILLAMPSQAALYTLSTTPDRQHARLAYLSEDPPWQRGRSQLRDAIQENTREVGAALGRVFLGTHGGQAGPSAGITLPVATFVACCQQSLARREDFERLWEAYRTRVIGSLARGDFTAADRVDAELRWHGTSGNAFEWIDRPAIWESQSHFPIPQEQLKPWRSVRRSIECARLILALRAYRDRRNVWPESLAALSPAWLSVLPSDPVTSLPFRYERHGDTFRLLAPRQPGHGPMDAVLYDSTTPTAKQAAWRAAHNASQ